MTHEMPQAPQNAEIIPEDETTVENPENNWSIRRISAVYTTAGLALTAVFIANKEFDKAVYTLGWTGIASLGLRIRDSI